MRRNRARTNRIDTMRPNAYALVGIDRIKTLNLKQALLSERRAPQTPYPEARQHTQSLEDPHKVIHSRPDY